MLEKTATAVALGYLPVTLGTSYCDIRGQGLGLELRAMYSRIMWINMWGKTCSDGVCWFGAVIASWHCKLLGLGSNPA